MMILMTDIANSVIDMIKWEHDSVEQHDNGRLPVLDLLLHIDPEDRANPVKHRFYQKDIANKTVVQAESSMPTRMKFSTLVEDLCRRLRNTSPSLLEAEKAALVRKFDARMIKVNHSEKFRIHVTETALSRFSSLQEDEKLGRQRLYRSPGMHIM